MAMQKTNKSQAIRDALAAHPDKSPLELSEVLKTQGLKIPPTYISTIKSNMKAKRRRKKPKAGKVASRASGVGNGLMAAFELVKASGGIEGAKAALGTIEQLSKVL